MEFKSIQIKKFRNFESIEVELSNKNAFFGMNDVGKTNFLYALRYVFDRETRKRNLIDSDFYQKDVSEAIEITVTIDISDLEDADSQKLRAQLKGNILSDENQVYIRLLAKYDKNELIANPEMFWGGDIENLKPMKIRGNYYEIDYVFNTVYIDAYVDLITLFKKNTNKLIESTEESDKDIIADIENDLDGLNEKIASLSGVKAFEDQITPEYQKFKSENIDISVKSEMAVKGLYANIVPYIKKRGEDLLYPTAGEGRKKLLVYSIYDLLSKIESEKKINIFLIEETENHLHRSMQLALSRVLFQDDMYKYLFVTTHSSIILSDMDNVNLVRVYNENKVDTESAFYAVPDDFKQKKDMLNRGLTEAVFANKVLLVEGPSEYALFSRVLSVVHPDYEVDDIYILPVNGITFKAYREILRKLKIKVVLKTDNDLRKASSTGKYSVLGFSRVNEYTKAIKLPTDSIDENGVDAKRALYDANKDKLDQIRKDDFVFLSRCSLEEDLDEVIHTEMVSYLPDADGNPISYLQGAKNYHMVELLQKITDEDCKNIYNHYNFECLKEVCK